MVDSLDAADRAAEHRAFREGERRRPFKRNVQNHILVIVARRDEVQELRRFKHGVGDSHLVDEAVEDAAIGFIIEWISSYPEGVVVGRRGVRVVEKGAASGQLVRLVEFVIDVDLGNAGLLVVCEGHVVPDAVVDRMCAHRGGLVS